MQVAGRSVPVAALFVVCAIGTAAAHASPTVTIVNETRGGSTSFYDGDGFLIEISGGLANAPVTLTQIRNGTAVADDVPEGTTDGTGSIRFSGYVLASEAGSWTEAWYVGGVPASLLHFTIGKLTSLPTLTPNTVPHDYYLFNRSSNVDTATDFTGLPHFFAEADAVTDPAIGITRGRCSLKTNPGTSYVPPGPFSWFNFNPQTPAAGPPLAVPGEYMQSPLFDHSTSGLNYQTTGFAFTGEFIGQAASAQTANPSYVESAYFSDRECFDGGTEYGWYRAPVISNGGNSENQPANEITFYYSDFTNCHGSYECEYADGARVFQNSNFYTITLKSPNSAGTYRFQFEVFRTSSDFGQGLVSYFVLSIKDPETGSPAPCSLIQVPATLYPSSKTLTSVSFTKPGSCSEVFVGIDTSWFPPPAVTATGYLSFADGSNPYFPESWFYEGSPAGNTPPASNIIPTIYPNGQSAPFAGFNVVSASELYAGEHRSLRPF